MFKKNFLIVHFNYVRIIQQFFAQMFNNIKKRR